jgi:hypothetical protein
MQRLARAGALLAGGCEPVAARTDAAEAVDSDAHSHSVRAVVAGFGGRS